MNSYLDAPELAQLRDANPLPTIPHRSHESPQAQQSLERILATERSPRTHAIPNHHRRLGVVAACVAVAVSLAGVAVAADIVPEGVLHAFAKLGRSGQGVTDAHLVAQTTTPQGIRVQMWIGHNTNGGRCEYTRTLAANGDHEDGGVGCFAGGGTPPTPKFEGGLEPAGNPLPPLTYIVTARTTLPSVSRIALLFPNGQTIPLALNHKTGYAIGVVPPRYTKMPSRLTAYNAGGDVIATHNQTATTLGKIGTQQLHTQTSSTR